MLGQGIEMIVSSGLASLTGTCVPKVFIRRGHKSKKEKIISKKANKTTNPFNVIDFILDTSSNINYLR